MLHFHGSRARQETEKETTEYTVLNLQSVLISKWQMSWQGDPESFTHRQVVSGRLRFIGSMHEKIE